MAVKPTRWPCVFRRPEIRQDVNPRLQRAYRESIKPGADPPYGALQGLWRREHCREINPYGSDTCPYEARDCILAYYKTAMDAIEQPGVRSVTGLFRILAHRRGLDRAENKPLARDRVRSTNGQDAGRSVGRDLEAGRDVRPSGLRSIRSMFGSEDG